MHNSFILQQYICYTALPNMFRAARCSSSGGPIVSPQPLVSSPSISNRTVCGLRADCSPLSTRMGGAVVRVKTAARIPCPHFQLCRNDSLSSMAAQNITLNKAMELFAAVIRMLSSEVRMPTERLVLIAFSVSACYLTTP